MLTDARRPVQGMAVVKNLDTPGGVGDSTLMATVTMTPEAFEQFDRLPKVVRARVRRLAARLEAWPAVIVDKVGHRSEFYED